MSFRRRKFRRRKQKATLRVTMFILVIVSFTIGYAYLNKTLNIQGTTEISKTTWNVRFANIQVLDNNAIVETSPALADNATKVNFSINLDKPGDSYSFTVDVVNSGTVDAKLSSITLTDGLASKTNYLDYSLSYVDGTSFTQGDLLKAGTTDTIKFTVTFKKDITKNDLESDDTILTLSLTQNYIQDDGTGVERNRLVEGTILSNSEEGVTISTKDHENELRFIGANPNNYVTFNNQTWRIIGVFNGKLKLIQDPIGNYSYDTSSSTVNRGYGVNQWGESTLTDGSTYTGADLMKLLNPGYESNQDLRCINGSTYDSTNGIVNCGDNSASNYDTITVNNSLYWNAGSGKCYTYGNYNTANCDFTSTGLKDTASKNMIDNAEWFLGSLDTPSANIWDGRITASVLYNWERSSSTGKQCSNTTHCSDTVNRTTTWTGKVGLLYPSDYAYATGGGSTYSRSECLNYTVGYVDNSSIPNWQNTYTDCKNNDWLLNTSMWTWTMTPRAFSSTSNHLFYVHTAGHVNSTNALNAGSVRPVVYLKSSVSFTGNGNGTQSNPYKLKMN